jgi:hypothetical protein
VKKCECGNPLPTPKYRGRPHKYCNRRCKIDRQILRRKLMKAFYVGGKDAEIGRYGDDAMHEAILRTKIRRQLG